MILKREISYDSIVAAGGLLAVLAGGIVKFDHVEAKADAAQLTANEAKSSHEKDCAVLFQNQREITKSLSELTADEKVLHQIVSDNLNKHN